MPKVAPRIQIHDVSTIPERKQSIFIFSCSSTSCNLQYIENVQMKRVSVNERRYLFSLSPEPHVLVYRLRDCSNDDYYRFCNMALQLKILPS